MASEMTVRQMIEAARMAGQAVFAIYDGGDVAAIKAAADTAYRLGKGLERIGLDRLITDGAQEDVVFAGDYAIAAARAGYREIDWLAHGRSTR